MNEIRPERIANKMRMLRADPTYASHCFLLVEGTTDRKFYARFVDDTCQIVVANGKEQVIAVMSVLDSDGFTGAVAIVDADFDPLEDSQPTSENIFQTDTHDLETLLIQSPALDKLLCEYGSEEKLEDKDVRSILLACGKPLGYLRWVSLREPCNLKFDGLRYDRILDKETLAIDTRQLVQTLYDRTEAKDRTCTLTELHTAMQELQSDTHDPWYVCCGHDLVRILSVGLRYLVGSCNATDVAPENLERSLRLAYEPIYFLATRLYQALRDWQQHYPTFTLLKASISG